MSGIPGNRMSAEVLDHLRNTVLKHVREIYECADQSNRLLAFNKTVASEAWSEHRSEIVWTKSPPLFGDSSVSQTAWKSQLEHLEMDTAFIRFLSEEPAWRSLEEQLTSNQNLWRALIEKFHLLDTPYITASAPSRQLIEELERAQQERIKQKTRALMERYQTNDEQEALSRFEQDELTKTKEIDQIQTRVTPPRFTDRPPLTQDDDIRYKQLSIEHVPVVATIFDRAPTLDIGLSFNLREIPQRYYRLLRLLPRCLDSLGLKEAGRTVPYSDLVGEIQKQTNRFSITYPFDSHAKTSELTIRAAATDTASFIETLNLIQKMMQFNWLDLSNADRLRDLVAQRVSSDEVFTRQAETNWVYDPVLALRHQDNPLFVAGGSPF